MSPSKMTQEAVGKKRAREERKLNITGKVNKLHEGKHKDAPKVRKIKTVLKAGKKIRTSAGMPKVHAAKKIRLEEKKKGNHQQGGKKLGAKRLRLEHMEEVEDVSAEEMICEPEEAGSKQNTNSINEGRNAFAWLIAPIKPETFFQNAWEKAPLHVKRTDYPDYYKAVLSSQKISEILRDNYVLFSKNIDVTSYRNGERQTHNPSGRATQSVVWDFYKQGCSVRMLNPQTFSPELRKLNATLQDFFGCFVGANSYLTPVHSQGFAPHYDDIEAFILQIEGKKHWKVYAPRKRQDALPRFSSQNFSQDDLKKPILEVTLHPGDLLYFPRGFIHQANTEPGHHSLHVTISCYQRNTWGDLLEKMLPAALAVAQEEDVEFRRGLPLDYLRHMGVSNCDQNTPLRTSFFMHLEMLFARLLKHAPVDAAVDQMAKQFMHDALPPVLSAEEESCSVFSEDNMKLKDDGNVCGVASLSEGTKVRLIRAHILRLVKEDDSNDAVQVYHCIDNSLEYHGEEPQAFDISSEFALAVEQLIINYPRYTTVSELILENVADKLELANLLWRKGLLRTKEPLGRKK